MPKSSASTQSGSSRQCSGPAEEAGLSWWHPQGQVPRPCPAVIAEGPRHPDPASPQAPQFSSVQFSPVPQSRPALCKPMDCSTPGLPVHQQLPQFTKNSSPLSRWCHPTISSSVIPFSCHLQSFPALGSFQMSQFFASGGQSIGVSVSASILPMHIQD